jgi:G:T-mismatch repair DNA endonuclease (very short patch repair protein)
VKQKTPNIWTEEQLKLLRENYQILSRKKLAELINQTENNIRTTLIELGLVNSENRKSYKNVDITDDWTIEEEKYLKINYDKLSTTHLINILNKSRSTISRKMKKLHLRRPKKIKQSTFTVYEIQILIDNFNDKTLEELEQLIPNKNTKQILRKASELKLKSSKQTIPEKIVEGILIKLGLDYKSQNPVIGTKFINDFEVGNIVIEVQGDYWHGNPKFYQEFNEVQQKMINRDKRKKKVLEKMGYKVLYLWEYDIKKNIEECERQILIHCSSKTP